MPHPGSVMSKTATSHALLRACIQDLYAGKRLLVERLPRVVAAIDDQSLRIMLEQIVEAADVQAERLKGTGLADHGPANLWMAGMIDDATRDSKSIEPGPLLDVALIGAVRKMRAAEIVSDQTAIAVAAAIGQYAVIEAVQANEAEEVESNRALAVHLHALAASVPTGDAAEGHQAKPASTGSALIAVAAAILAGVGGWAMLAPHDRSR